MESQDRPWWVEESYDTFLNPTRPSDEWKRIEEWNDEAYSRIISIHYPPSVHVFYIVDALRETGWEELKGIHYSQALADNAARKRSYSDGIPHRVRIVTSYE